MAHPAPARLEAVLDDREPVTLVRALAPGAYRWAIFDRKTRTLYFGPETVHIHMTVAEHAGVLSHHPSYYAPGANVLGGFVCRSRDGDWYYDPFSGTFPGTNAGVAEAEAAFREICAREGLPFRRYDDIPDARKVVEPGRPSGK